MPAAYFRQDCASKKHHAEPKLLPDDLKCPLHSLLAIYGKSVDNRPADEDPIGSKRQCLQDWATLKPAVWLAVKQLLSRQFPLKLNVTASHNLSSALSTGTILSFLAEGECR